MKLNKPQLSALEVHHLVKELQVLIDSKVDKIYHPEKKELILQLHKTGTGKLLIRFKVPEYFCITENKQTTQFPSSFCAYLRKKLGNSFLSSIEQKGFERIIEIEFRTKEGKLSLVFEFFNPGNILLLENNIILSAVEYQEYTSRKIRPKEEYKYPTKEFNFLKITEDNLRKMLETTNRASVVKALAIDLGLGGLFAEEACFNAGIDKDKKPKDVKKIKELFASLKQMRDKKINPVKIKEEIVPFVLKSREGDDMDVESFSKAIDDSTKKEISGEQQEIEDKYLEKLRKINNMIKSQESTIKKLSKQEEESKEKGDIIYGNFQKVEQVLSEAKKSQTKDGLEKLKKEKKIKNYDLKDKTITVEL